MKILVLECAETELVEAVEFYNGQRPGLGFELAVEFKAALLRIGRFPAAWPRFSERSRRCMINRFPFGVLYQERGDFLLVVAFMDLRRDPTRWDEHG